MEQYKRFIRFCTSASLLALEALIYWYFWKNYFSVAAGTPFYRRGDWLMLAVYAILLMFFSKMYGGFRVGYFQKGNILFSQILTVLMVNIISYLQTALLAKHFPGPQYFLVMSVLDAVVIILWTFIADAWFQRMFPPRKMLLIYGNRPSLILMDKMNERKDRYEIVKTVHVDAGIDRLTAMCDGYDAVIICDVPSETRNNLLKYCFARSIRAYMTPKLSDILIRSAEEIHLFDTPLLLARNSEISIEQLAIKRIIDILLSLLGIVVLSPVMLVAAVAIKCCDAGPVMFRQERLTIGGRPYMIFKFRSMIVDAEKDGIPRMTTEHDSRITPVGAWLRKLRIDEIPQLFNILLGDMSVVGPRPERPEIFDFYSKNMPEFDYRLKVKAGLTGYAQVYGKYNTTPYDKLKMDLNYIQNYSLRLDMKLILLTFKVLFMKDSSQGIAQGETTAPITPPTRSERKKDEGAARWEMPPMKWRGKAGK
ncbi:MAG: sugar transferase [Lachnospiraceae bacterium]|nr:sugar transferase [Lachnospiraceae bacterium]